MNLNGKDHEPDFALRMPDGIYARSAIRKMYALGFRFFRLATEPNKLEKSPGVYDFTSLDTQARMALHEAPGACTDEGFSDAAMSDLVGMRLEGAGREPTVVCADEQARQTVFGGWRKELETGAVSCFLSSVPVGYTGWHAVLDALGTDVLCPAGEYVRRHGDVILFHTARAGRHTLKLPPDLANRTFSELVHGGIHKGPELVFETDGCDTLLFKGE